MKEDEGEVTERIDELRAGKVVADRIEEWNSGARMER